MSTRLDRYRAAVMLAQIIGEGEPADDERRLDEAFRDVRDELAALRLNQQEFPQHLQRVLQLIGGDTFSRRVPPPLRLVTEEQFELLAYPNGRGDT